MIKQQQQQQQHQHFLCFWFWGFRLTSGGPEGHLTSPKSSLLLFLLGFWRPTSRNPPFFVGLFFCVFLGGVLVLAFKPNKELCCLHIGGILLVLGGCLGFVFSKNQDTNFHFVWSMLFFYDSPRMRSHGKSSKHSTKPQQHKGSGRKIQISTSTMHERPSEST